MKATIWPHKLSSRHFQAPRPQAELAPFVLAVPTPKTVLLSGMDSTSNPSYNPIRTGAFRVCPGNLKFFILIFNVIFEYLNEGFILNRAAESQHLIAVF